jgi:hypothetical protein
MWLLLFCSVLAGAVFLERTLYFHRVTLVLGEFLRGLAELIRHKRWAEAVSALMQYADDKLAEYASAEKVVKLRPSITLPNERQT